MHELSLCRSLLTLLQQQAEEQGFSRVHCIWLEVGPLAAVVPAAMELAFSACSQGTLAEGAELHLLQPEAQGRCRNCGAVSTMSSRIDLCPECGAEHMLLISGDSLMVKELEVE